MGISVKTLHNWLSDQKPKDLEQVKKVADFFQISIDSLCFGEGIKSTQEAIENYRDEINAGVFEVVLRRVKK